LNDHYTNPEKKTLKTWRIPARIKKMGYERHLQFRSTSLVCSFLLIPSIHPSNETKRWDREMGGSMLYRIPPICWGHITFKVESQEDFRVSKSLSSHTNGLFRGHERMMPYDEHKSRGQWTNAVVRFKHGWTSFFLSFRPPHLPPSLESI
jgi:hypothetical protein